MEPLAECGIGQGSRKERQTPARESDRRVLILWSHLPHYLAACIRVLLVDYRAQVLLIVQRTDEQSNHVPLQASAGFQYVALSAAADLSPSGLIRRIQDFAPDVAVAGCSRWGALTRMAKVAKTSGARVLWATDHCWRGSWHDYANAICCRLGLTHRFWDGVWVPGSFGRRYARKLGFADSRIFEGVYACDTELFRRRGAERFESGSSRPWPRVFLFLGQYIERKNLATLLRAYCLYRDTVSQPWELWCAGRGPLRGLLQGREGVRDCGYQDASGCAALMSQAGAFVLASWIDHWGVVIHEAACAGLPILASRTCGATAHLVRDGYNGYSFAPQDAERLCRLMQLMSEERHAAVMGQNSLKLSYQFDPKFWAAMLFGHISDRSVMPQVMEGQLA